MCSLQVQMLFLSYIHFIQNVPYGKQCFPSWIFCHYIYIIIYVSLSTYNLSIYALKRREKFLSSATKVPYATYTNPTLLYTEVEIQHKPTGCVPSLTCYELPGHILQRALLSPQAKTLCIMLVSSQFSRKLKEASCSNFSHLFLKTTYVFTLESN